MDPQTTEVTIGSSTYSATDGILDVHVYLGTAFSSGEVLSVQVVRGGVATTESVVAPTFTRDVTVTAQGRAWALDWQTFEADEIVFAFLAAAGGEVACRKDVSGLSSAARTLTFLTPEIARDMAARGWRIGLPYLGACKRYPERDQLMQQALRGGAGHLELCQSILFGQIDL